MFWSVVREKGNGERAALERQKREIARKGKYSFDRRHSRGVAADVSGEIPGHEWSSGTGVYNFASVRRREGTRRIVTDGERKF